MIPKGPFGTLVHEKFRERRNDDGSAYTVEQFAKVLQVQSGKTVRDYITGRTRPKTAQGWLNVAKGLEVPVAAVVVLAAEADISAISPAERLIVRQALSGMGAELEAALGAVGKQAHSPPSAQVARHQARPRRVAKGGR